MVQLDLCRIDETALHTGTEELLKVQFLPDVSHVNDTVGVEIMHSVLESCQVRGLVAEAAVLLFDNHRRLLLLFWIIVEDANRAIALLSKTSVQKLLDHWFEHWVVETLAAFL